MRKRDEAARLGVVLYGGVEPIDVVGTIGVVSMAARVLPAIEAVTIAHAAGPVALGRRPDCRRPAQFRRCAALRCRSSVAALPGSAGLGCRDARLPVGLDPRGVEEEHWRASESGWAEPRQWSSVAIECFSKGEPLVRPPLQQV